jgi:hypothetical protein
LAFSGVATTADDFDTNALNFDNINFDKFLEGGQPSLSRIPPSTITTPSLFSLLLRNV